MGSPQRIGSLFCLLTPLCIQVLDAVSVSAVGTSYSSLGGGRELLNFTESEAPIDSYKQYACRDCLQGRTVRVMYFEVDYVVENPVTRKMALDMGMEYGNLCDDPERAFPECFDHRNWNSGWVGELGFEIIEHLGVDVVALTRANFTDEVYEVYKGVSSYSRCVYEVNLGNVDLCMGNFWETNARRPIATFTSPFELDSMNLLTMPGESQGFSGSDLLGIFRPYDNTVWTVTACFFVMTAIAIYAIQAGGGHWDFEYEDSIVNPPARVAQGLIKSLYLTLMGYVTQAPQHNDSGWGVRVTLLGYAFMLYITISSYTANLASFMIIIPKVQGQIKSFSDIKYDASKKICYLEALDTGMIKVVDSSKMLFDDYGPMLEKMYNGECDASVIGKMEYLTYVKSEYNIFPVCKDANDPFNYATCQDESIDSVMIELRCSCPKDVTADPVKCPLDCPDYRKYCSVVPVADPDFNFALAFAWPISHDLLNYFSAWIVRLRLEGKVDRYYQQYVTSNFPDVCAQEVDLEAEPLSIESMAGTYVISVALMVMGMILHLYYSYVLEPQGKSGPAEEEVQIKQIPAHGSPLPTAGHHHTNAQELMEELSKGMDGMLGRLEVMEAEVAARSGNGEKSDELVSPQNSAMDSAMERVATATRFTISKAFNL